MHVDYIIGNEDTGFDGVMRSYLDEPVDEASDWDNPELLDYVNLEHRHLFSVIRNYNEDWFGKVHVFPLVASQYEYFLPLDCVTPRRIEIIRASAVTGSSPNYVVDEDNAGPQEVNEIHLNAKQSFNPDRTRGYVFSSGYYLFDEKLIFEPNQGISSENYCRIYYSPQAPDLHRGIAQAATSTTLTLADNALTTTVGRVRNIDNYYKGMRIEIISGTGVGQLKRITQHVGSTGVITIESAWDTTPTSSSVYSIVSPIQEDYQELLVLGGALRAKGIKVEDDTSGIGTVYTAIREDMDNALEKRNHQFNRRVVTSRRSLWL